ncbi:MAG: sulfotransferase family protein [Gemmatimonadales bacterium]
MKRLFIVGCPRSGTTWTMMLVARHPDAVTCMQVSVMHSLHELYRAWGRGGRRDDTRYLNSVVLFDGPSGGNGAAARFEPLFANEEELLHFCRDTADRAFSGALARRPEAELLVVKTPEDLRIAEFVHRVYPDAYFLHVIRDPRAVFASQRKGADDFGGRWPRGPAQGARYWAWDVKRGRKIAALTERYAEVRYEALTANPAAELGRIIRWLGLPADPAWCEEAARASSFRSLKETKGTPRKFFRSGEAEGWRRELSASDLRIIEHLSGTLMADLGYARTRSTRRWPPVRLVLGDGFRTALGGIGRMVGKILPRS